MSDEKLIAAYRACVQEAYDLSRSVMEFKPQNSSYFARTFETTFKNKNGADSVVNAKNDIRIHAFNNCMEKKSAAR